MANTFKLKTKANVGITTQNVYVVPSATTTVVIGITLANITVSVLKNVPIPQGSSLEFMAGNKVVLEAADTLTVNSDTSGSIDVSLTIMETT